jgi:DNA-binding SARP family transcriptional activator
MQTLAVHLLGGFSLLDGDKQVTTLNSARLQSFIAYLALKHDAPQNRRYLSFLFWPESTETQARTNLRKLIFNLKRRWPAANHYIKMNAQQLQWTNEALLRVDVFAFKAAASQAHTIDQLEAIVEIYKGDLLPGNYEDWVLSERQSLYQIYVTALESLIELLESNRQYHRAIDYTQRLLQVTPLQENTYRRLMRLYALNGDRAGVIRIYHECVTVLQRELDVVPSQLTRQEYKRLLDNNTALSFLTAPSTRLIGRHAEWAKLQAAWHKAVGGEPQWVLLSGDEGSGKTRLAQELLQWASLQGISTAGAQCFSSERRLSYAPLRALLRSQALQSLDRLWLREISAGYCQNCSSTILI